MYETTFNPNYSHLKSFKRIGYHPSEQLLHIYLNNGDCLKLSSVKEETVFQLITTYDKEAFLKERLAVFMS